MTGYGHREGLTWALASLAVHGRRTPCQEPVLTPLWHGDAAERAQAERECLGCPVLALCRAYGDEIGERWGVLGGVDRERKAGAA